MTSIVFSPTSPYTETGENAPEEDVISLDEETQRTYASQPKLWNIGKTMKSSVNLQKKKKKTKQDGSKRCETVI